MRRTVLLCLVAPGLLETPMALLGIIGVVLLVEATKQPCQIFVSLKPSSMMVEALV
jgi:hypothetical protein